MRRLLVALLVCAAVPALARFALHPAPGRVSPVVFPPQTLALRFSHRSHAGTACERCHPAGTSTTSADRLLPPEASCTGAGCHAIDREHPSPACGACHAGYDPVKVVARSVVPQPNLKFSHAAHSALARCATCHGDVAARDQVSRDDLPRMAGCARCHDGVTASAACTTCHLGLPDGRMRVSFPEGTLRPSGQMRADAHVLDFAATHAVAGRDQAYCASCHKPRFCEDCHTGVVKPAGIHPGDYLTLHPIDARKSSTRCATCHTQQTFCVGCHRRSGVSPDGPGPFARPGLRFHPAGWSDGAQRHAPEAMRNLTTCASCHRESTCQRCHSGRTAASPVTPHPRGFAGSAACRAMSARNQRMCLKCHALDRDRARLDCQ